ncbi:MAG: threonine aldolase family protein [Fimbriimonas sp.]
MIVDLRSDTVTRPTPEMYAAMATAPLGDDVLGDDPTVTALETLAAEMVGKEASLFVPSGTMGNQIAIATHCERGDAMIVEEEAHTVYYEVGGSALIAGVVTWTLPSVRGTMDPENVERHVLSRDLHRPGTTLLCLENTHNRAGGAIIPQTAMAAYREIADRHEMIVHLDGARVFNAAVGLGVDVREITQYVDTVNFCLSKGLRAPIGSMLCGPKEFIDKARRWRKRLGGGIRQGGILAACGIESLTNNVARLAEDHARAKTIGTALAELGGLHVNLEGVETNLLMVETTRPAVEWQLRLHELGIWCFPVAANRLRLVLHADIDDAMVSHTIAAFRHLSQVG